MLTSVVRFLTAGAIVTSTILVACSGTTNVPTELAEAAQPWVQKGADGGTPNTFAPITHADAGTSSTSTSAYPATHAAQPQLVSSGGPVLTAPRFVPIVFHDDPYIDQIEAFVPQIATSSYLAGATAEYGVGAAAASAPIELTEKAPAQIDDKGIQAWLAAKLKASVTTFPAPEEGIVYTIYYPAETTVTLEGATSCVDFGGYHYETDLGGGHHAVYIVVPRCDTLFSLGGFDVVTAATAHEMIEAMTDPFPDSNPAFQGPDAADVVWGALIGGEAGDLCAVNLDAFFTPSDFPFVVQRTWSNAAAAASHDPCQPSASNSPYFNSAPLMSDAIHVAYPGISTAGARGLHIPMGQSKTIELDLFSDRSTTAPWSVEMVDLGPVLGSGNQTLKFKLDHTQGENGDHFSLTVTALASDPLFGGEAFLVESKLGDETRLWWAAVGN